MREAVLDGMKHISDDILYDASEGDIHNLHLYKAPKEEE